jgi:hypothetical protein
VRTNVQIDEDAIGARAKVSVTQSLYDRVLITVHGKGRLAYHHVVIAQAVILAKGNPVAVVHVISRNLRHMK